MLHLPWFRENFSPEDCPIPNPNPSPNPGGNLFGCNFSGGNFTGGNFPVTIYLSYCTVICAVMILCNEQKKFSIENLFSKCDQIDRKLRIWSRLL